MKLGLVAMMFVWLPAFPTWAQPGDRLHGLANELATCAAAYNAVSDKSGRESKDLGRFFAGLASESIVAAAMALTHDMSWEQALGLVRNAAAARLVPMRASLARGGPDGPFGETMSQCQSLHPVQAKLAREAQQLMRSAR
ncbi:MAG: hypothetical protein ACPGOV_05010 [Magnetovibrionaceae bacterium]